MSELALPEGWIKTEISNVADVIAGGTPSSKNSDYFSEPGTDIPWLTPADLTGYEKMYISHGRRDITEAGYKSSSAKLMPKGSVVFSSRAPIGYVAIAEKDLSTNQGFKSFVVPEELSSEYLYFYLKSIKGLAESLGTGTTFKELSGRVCKKLPLIMAPLAEQKVIAHTLEYNLKTVSQIQARLDAIPKLIEKFRQSVLIDAVSGKLTEEWREKSETKSINLNDITEFWREKYLSDGKKYKSPTFESLSEKPILPNKWQYTQLGKVFDVYVGATPSRKESQYWSGKIPWVSSSEVAFRRIEDTKEKVTDVGVKNTSTSIHPVGTVMLAMIGQGKTRGQAAILDIEACHNQNTAAIRIPKPFVISDYLYFYLMKMYQETRMVGSGNNQKALNKSRVQSLAFRLPPINEQEQIVKQVNQLFAYADQIVKSIATAKARVDHLTQSILHQAFTGNLTAEWRAQNSDLISGDNSAEALLAKIQAEKKKASKA